MKLDLRLERFYPHPPEKVWRALTTSDLLAQWLMDNDFEAVPGHRFSFRYCSPQTATETTMVSCQVLALDAPRQMVWSWRHEGEPETRVVFELLEQPGGTLLKLHHSGELSEALHSGLSSGWPDKLVALAAVLSNS